MADVKFTGKSDFEKVKKDYEDLARRTAKVEAENKKLKTTSDRVDASMRKTGRSQSSMLQAGIASTRSLIASYGGVHAALALVTKELEAQKRLSRESLQANMTIAQAESAVIKNLGDVSDKAALSFIDRVKKVSQSAGMSSSVPSLQAASSILSAVGGDQKTALEIVGVSAPLFRDTPEQMATFGGGLGDMMKSTKQDAKQTAALMLAIQGQARFETLEAFKNVAPAMAAANVVAKGDPEKNVREAAALFAAVGSRAGDKEGAVTKTAVTNLMANMQALLPELDTSFERLAAIQKDPELQTKVLKKGFKGAIKPIIRELVSGSDSQTSQMVSDAFEKIVGSEAAFERKTKQLTGLTASIRATTTASRARGNVETALLTPGLSRQATARDIVTETLDKTATKWGMSSVTNWLEGGRFEMGAAMGAPELAAIEVLKSRKKAVMRDSFHGFPSALEMAGAEYRQKKVKDLSPAERGMVELIDRQIALLEQQRQNQSNNRAAQAERTAHTVE